MCGAHADGSLARLRPLIIVRTRFQTTFMTVAALEVPLAHGHRLATVFLLVFMPNVLPVFAPTWVARSAFSVVLPDVNPFGLALTGAAAATWGRIMLAKLARLLLRGPGGTVGT